MAVAQTYIRGTLMDMDPEEQRKTRNHRRAKKRYNTVRAKSQWMTEKKDAQRVCELLTILQSLIARRGVKKVLDDIREM